MNNIDPDIIFALKRIAADGESATMTRKTMKRHNISLFGTEEKPTIEKVIDGLFEPVTRPRRVVISRAGGFVKARYAGRKTFVFGFDEKHARGRLKYWDDGVPA